MQELHEAQSTISRLTAQHARSVGWETRLSAAIQEKDDMQQERDGESNRAKRAESRLATMKDKAGSCISLPHPSARITLGEQPNFSEMSDDSKRH